MICSDTERQSGAIPTARGDAFEPYGLSRHSFCVLSTPPANGAVFNSKRHHLFAVQMLIGPLRFAFVDSLVGQERRKQRGDKRGKDLISGQHSRSLLSSKAW